MAAPYPGPSPAAAVGVAPSGPWSFDIYEYAGDNGGERTFQLALFVRSGQFWTGGKTLFNCPMYTRGTVAMPDGSFDNLSFMELIARYGSDWGRFIADRIGLVNAWMAANLGGGGGGNDDAAATAARQAIAGEVFGYKSTPDGMGLVRK